MQVSERLQDDYGLVHDAVRRHGDALRFASESLANTEPIVKAAVALPRTSRCTRH